MAQRAATAEDKERAEARRAHSLELELTRCEEQLMRCEERVQVEHERANGEAEARASSETRLRRVEMMLQDGGRSS